MNEENVNTQKEQRRKLGIHLTSSDIFEEYIYSEISEILYDYLWVDLYCGEGNLIFPILDKINERDRSDFFGKHIFLSDIQPKMVQRCKDRARAYGIEESYINKNVVTADNLNRFPSKLKRMRYPIFHITNPPYLYLGYIRKHKETKSHLKYFTDNNDGYQDLYQIAMINDLRQGIKNLIYIIPTNFIFGASVSNKFRKDFLRYYNIKKIIIFESKIFRHTGTNILIGFFERKSEPSESPLEFSGIKLKTNKKFIRSYHLVPEFNYRAGTPFYTFIQKHRIKTPLKVSYYLKKSYVQQNNGSHKLAVIDSNKYRSGKYQKRTITINKSLFKKIKSNILYVKTVDSGSYDGRAGLYKIKTDFDVDGILVSGNTYRTSPIHLFLEPSIPLNDQELLMNYFNFILEYFRKKLDSEFLTTYKYSNAKYTRKYLGLRQVRKIIKTFPILELTDNNKLILEKAISNKSFSQVRKILK
ncbi:MAG: N-6 DNA methylase [Candidatus Lokiarchaeota archaeon]|nr:N-6 DNA methylase [Candidatus Lokiarchaeota archaeon]